MIDFILTCNGTILGTATGRTASEAAQWGRTLGATDTANVIATPLAECHPAIVAEAKAAIAARWPARANPEAYRGVR